MGKINKNDPRLKMLILLLCTKAYNDCRDRHYITREALLRPEESPWRRVLDHAANHSLV